MLAVSVARRSREYREYHVRPECADDSYDVSEQTVLRPVAERLGCSFGKTEIVRPREILVRAIDPPRRQQLLGANHAELFAELVADEILAAVAARQREISCLRSAAARHPGDEIGVFVIRMRRDDKQTVFRVDSVVRASYSRSTLLRQQQRRCDEHQHSREGEQRSLHQL